MSSCGTRPTAPRSSRSCHWPRRPAPGVKALAAARLARLDSSKGPDWLAGKGGITRGAARRHLDTAKKLDDCPSTRAGLQDGTLSLDQADESASTEEAAPGRAPEPLGPAKNKSLGGLSER